MKTDKEINADTTQESQADLRANPTAVSQAIESNETKPDVLYIPDFLTQAEADELLARIRTAADFRQNYIQIYGRKAIPRLEAWYLKTPFARSMSEIAFSSHLFASAGVRDLLSHTASDRWLSGVTSRLHSDPRLQASMSAIARRAGC